MKITNYTMDTDDYIFFMVNSNLNCYFTVNGINEPFYQSDIDLGFVIVYFQGGTSLPYADFQVFDSYSSGSLIINFEVQGMDNINIINYSMIIIQTKIDNSWTNFPLKSDNFMTNDSNNSPPTLINYKIDDCQYCYFENSNSEKIATFTQDDINNGIIYFAVAPSSINTNAITPIASFYVNVGSTQSSKYNANITYIFNPVKLHYSIYVNQGGTLTLSSVNLNSLVYYNTAIYYIQSSVNGMFQYQSNPGIPITQFYQNDINSNLIQYVHDGSNNHPSAEMILSDGHTNITFSISFNFILLPYMVNNNFKISQSQQIIISSDKMSGIDPSGYMVMFTASSVKYGNFFYVFDTINSIASFSENDIANGNVLFIQDGSANAPSCYISASSQVGISTPNLTNIVFTASLTLLSNTLIISTGETATITTAMINAISNYASSSEIIFTVSNIANGEFEISSSPRIAITTFSLDNINNGLIVFASDGSQNAPSYQLAVTDGFSHTEPKKALVSFNGKIFAIVEINNIQITQGDTVTLKNSMLKINNGDPTADFLLIVQSAVYSHFEEASIPGVPIYQFTQSKINNDSINFIADGSKNPPVVNLSCTNSVNKEFYFSLSVHFSLMPIIFQNNFVITKGKAAIITLAMLAAYSLDTNNASLIYLANNVQNGEFEYVANPGVAITSFSQYSVTLGLVAFQPDGSDNVPKFTITVSNGVANTNPVSAQIQFLTPKGITAVEKIGALQTDYMSDIFPLKNPSYLLSIQHGGIVAVISLLNQQSPQIISSLNVLKKYGFGSLNKLTINSDVAFITSDDVTLAVVGVVNSSNNTLLTNLSQGISTYDLEEYQNYTFLAGGPLGILVYYYDYTKNSLISINNVSVGENVISVSTCGNYLLYVTQNNTINVRGPGNLYAINITNMANLSKLSNFSVTLSDSGTFIIVSADNKTAFVSTLTTIDIFDVTNVNTSIAKKWSSIPLPGVLSLTLNSDGGYLSALKEKNGTMINVKILSNPVVLQTLSYNFGLSSQYFTPDFYWSYYASSEGLQTVQITKGLQSSLPPFLKQNNISNLTLNQTVQASCQHIEVSSDEKYTFLGCGINGMKIININSSKIVKSINGNVTDLQISNDGNFLYFTKDGIFQIWDITTLPTLTPKTIAKSGYYISSFKVSQKDNLALVVSDTFHNYTVFGISSSKSLTYYDKTVKLSGLVIIDLTNRTNLTIFNQTLFANFISIAYYTDNVRDIIFGTTSTEGSVFTIDASNPKLPVQIGKGYVGKFASGIVVLPSNNYIVVQSQYTLTTLEIRDPGNPVVVNQITSSNIQATLDLASSNFRLYLPVFMKYSYFELSTFIYPILTSGTSSGNKIFNVNFYPVVPDTMDQSNEKVILLQMKVDGKWPYWANFDSNNQNLIINPPSSSSLAALRSMYLTYSTEIKVSELDNIVSNYSGYSLLKDLVSTGYVQTDSFVTLKFNPLISLNLSNLGQNIINATAAITYILNNHFFIQSITFDMNDFLALDSPPSIGLNNLQSQFENVLIKINNKVDFQFSADTFFDLDRDTLTYTTSLLPTWLSFFAPASRFYGTPICDDIKNNTIFVYASDGYKNISDKFQVNVINRAPTYVFAGNQKSIGGQLFDWTVPSKTFSDPDGDDMTYKSMVVNVSDANGSLVNLPVWITFDASRLRLFGTPSKNDVAYNNTLNMYYQVFSIVIIAYDYCKYNGIMPLNLTILNHPPSNNSNTLQDVYIVVALNQLDFVVPQGLFSDPDNDTLTYGAFGYNSTNNSIIELPNWLTFNEHRQLFEGNPEPKDIYYNETSNNYYQEFPIYLTATDPMDQEASIIFKIIVVNYAPIENPQNSLEKQFQDNPASLVELKITLAYNSFLDKNNGSTLTYTIREAGKNNAATNSNDSVSLPSWIIFDTYAQTFHITAPESEIFSVYHINVTVSNGLLTSWNTVRFRVIISWITILKITAGVLSFCLSILAYYAYRAQVYDLLCKKKYVYPKEERIKVHEYFQKEIYLIGEDIEIGDILFDNLKKKKIESGEKTWDDFTQNEENLEQILQKCRKEIIEQNKNVKEINLDLLKIDCRVFEVVKGYINYEKLSEDKFTEVTYKKVKEILTKEFSNQWYKELVTIESRYEDDVLAVKFPYIILKNSEIEKYINTAIAQIKAKKEAIGKSFLDIKMKLFQECLKTESIGIPRSGKTSNQGESICCNNEEIAEIQVARDGFKKKSLLSRLIGLLPMQSSANMKIGKLKQWIDYKFKKGIIVFYGTPDLSDIGKIKLLIFDGDSFVLKEFYLEVAVDVHNDEIFTIHSPKHKNSKTPILDDEMSLIPQNDHINNLPKTIIPIDQ